MKEREYRYCAGQEFRALSNDAGEKVIEGHAAVFNCQTQIVDWFNEVIEKGAFDGCDMRDVPLMINHDFRRIPLARSRRNNGNSTLTLTIDDKGLAIRATLDTENNTEARALYSAVERGDVSGMSFSFTVEGEEWEDLGSEMPTRRIKKIGKIYEVSAVNFPQYKETDIYARAESTLESAKRALENARRRSVDTGNEIEIYKVRNQILGVI